MNDRKRSSQLRGHCSGPPRSFYGRIRSIDGNDDRAYGFRHTEFLIACVRQ
jgi:hypothetical protein